MKNTIKFLTLSLLVFVGACGDKEAKVETPASAKQNIAMTEDTKTIHDFTITTIDGETFDLSEMKGKKLMIVNTASKCGLTPQYVQLQELYNQYGGEDFQIIGFPANNFGAQEPGTDEEIASFCTVNYGVTFPMMSKISVKGNDQHELYQWLTQKEQNGVLDSEVQWNFQKYLINPDGTLHSVIAPRTEPTAEEVIAFIKA